jgi:radical SAM protein with 4Fe4S-binding SPASM domain
MPEFNLENCKKLHDFEFLFKRPAQVQFDLTNKCNLNCIYCYNKYNLLEKNELTDEDLKLINKKIIEQLNPLYVSFSGGEPLTRSNILIELANSLKKNNIKVHLNTNLLLINEEIAKKINEIKFDKINVNIDSLDKQDEIRGGKNLLKKLFSSLDILEKYVDKKIISIACVINKLNYKDIYKIASLVKEKGYMELHLLDMIPCDDSKIKYTLSKKEWLEFYEIYKNIKNLNIKIKPNHALIFLSESNRIRIPFCMAGRFKMVITANGNIVPCNYFKSNNFICGNALEDNLMNVWTNSTIMKKFRYFMPKEEKCIKCKLVDLCTGGCRAFAETLLGDAFRGDPYCVIQGLRDEK